MLWFLLFPGVVVHELSHYVACLITGTKVTHTKWFGIKEASVTHASRNFLINSIIALFPFLFGTSISVLLIYIALHSNELPLSAVTLWIALSSSYFCFPSKTDIDNASTSLIKFYKASLAFKKGLLDWLFALVSLPLLFVPIYCFLELSKFFASIKHLGLLWFILQLLFFMAYT
ncbi:MAG: hypothetical protein J7K68_06115 [Candidatus Diapherotrites archaeon]|nr:hypothetical protein [Candidatus Diapherotrites archaeon]